MNQEEQWIVGLKQGKAEALHTVYGAYKDELFSLALVLCQNRSQAEDALQDVFLQLASQGPGLAIRGNLKAYLATCVVNRIRSQVRRRRAFVPLDPSLTESEERSPDRELQVQESYRRVEQALASLPLEQREVVVLHLHSGLTFKAIAQHMNVSINTAQSRYRYAITKLRGRLNGEMTT